MLLLAMLHKRHLNSGLQVGGDIKPGMLLLLLLLRAGSPMKLGESHPSRGFEVMQIPCSDENKGLIADASTSSGGVKAEQGI